MGFFLIFLMLLLHSYCLIFFLEHLDFNNSHNHKVYQQEEIEIEEEAGIVQQRNKMRLPSQRLHSQIINIQ